MNFRWIRVVIVLFMLVLSGAVVDSAVACPMCKEANESEGTEEVNNVPKAYMYSIFFMISMPATLLTGFGVTFYRLSKQQQNASAELLDDYGLAADHHLLPDGVESHDSLK